jgi:hypothetical protein
MAAPLRHCNERSSALRSLVGGGGNCYDRGQVRFRAAVITIAIAIAAAPVMLDACLFTCHAPQTGEAGAVPSCHHASGSGARFRALPVPCGHDHGGLVAALEPSSRGVRDISGQPAPALIDLPAAGSIDRRVELLHIDGRRLLPPRATSELPLRI